VAEKVAKKVAKKSAKKVVKKGAKKSKSAMKFTKKSRKRTREVLVVASKVKSYIKGKNMNTSADAINELSDKVYSMLDAATARAKAKGRRTVVHIPAGPLNERRRPAEATSPKSPPKHNPKELEVPKLPAIFQQRLNELIEESKRRDLSQAKQSALDELLDYLDDQTAYELEKIIRTQPN